MHTRALCRVVSHTHTTIYHQQKSEKPGNPTSCTAPPHTRTEKPVVAKSSIVLEVKPWDDETDVKEIERLVRTITADGLLWGASKFVPVAYGIKKLQINCIVEDDKIGTDFLEETITGFEDLVSYCIVGYYGNENKVETEC